MTNYTEEFKAQVIADILLGTSSLKQISEKHNIPYNTVLTWNSRIVKHSELAIIEMDEMEVKKHIGDYLLEILQSNLDAQVAQLKVFADEEWLKRQSAQEIGVLHGILHDKASRMIGLLRDANNPWYSQAGN